MKRTISTTLLLLMVMLTYNLKAQHNGWIQNGKEKKTINNITYSFPAEIAISRRNAAIKECQKSIEENLKLIHETEFKNEIDVEFLSSRKEMLKYTGMAAQGMAFPDRGVFFSLLKDKGSPIKHEMMHMITMYKWGFPPNSSTWMNEGLATYAGGTCSAYSLEEIYQYFVQSKKLIPMNTIVNDFYAESDMITYTQSAYLVKYLIDNHGFEKFIKLWKEGYSDFNKIYGIDFEDIQHKISVELSTKYPKGIDFNWDEFNKGCR